MILGNLIGVELFFLIAGAAIGLLMIYVSAQSIRYFLLQSARDVLQFVHSAKQLQVDHERSRNELEFQQSKNDLQIEFARDRLRSNRQKLLSDEVR